MYREGSCLFGLCFPFRCLVSFAGWGMELGFCMFCSQITVFISTSWRKMSQLRGGVMPVWSEMKVYWPRIREWYFKSYVWG